MVSPTAPLPAARGRSPQAQSHWWRSVRLALGTATALGFGRFAYGLLVPAMRDELGWTLAQSGALTTANGLGYLAGALVTAAAVRRMGTTGAFRLGMVICTTALVGNAAGSAYPVLLTARALAGVGGALVFITGAVIAARLTTAANPAGPIIVYFAGTGLGIVLGGAAIPPLLEHHPARWPLAWIMLGLAAGLATLVSWTAAQTQDVAGSGQRRVHLRPLWWIAVAYVLFATGYITYITFLSVQLVNHTPSTTQVALTWVLLGLGVVVAPSVWNRPMATWPGTRLLTLLLTSLSAAAALLLISPTPVVVIVSAVTYGVTFMSVPAAVTALVRANTPAENVTSTLAAFTALFAAGQTVGPWLAGALADHTTPNTTVGWTAVFCAAGALFAAAGSRVTSSRHAHRQPAAAAVDRPTEVVARQLGPDSPRTRSRTADHCSE